MDVTTSAAVVTAAAAAVEGPLFLDAVIIMLIGMGVVFIFLAIMILVMNLTSKILNSPAFLKMFPQEKPAPVAIPQQIGNLSEMEEIAVAIAIAKAKA